ncbi:glucosaminidase domain-containing protein [Candidatus Saccharibacteria bacterium]|nr:glucosaminidase domain-containing protein [Candidatus Saccharibacteria bacterium]
MNLNKFKFGWVALFFSGLLLFSLVFLPLKAVALTSTQLDEFSQNNILFYDPDDNCAESYQSTYVEEVSAYGGLSSLQVRFLETYHDTAVINSINYGIPWETVMAQGILESASGTSDFAIQRNNFFGIGAFDSNPDAAYSYSTPAEGWEGYYKNIQATETYRNHGVFAGDTVTDPHAYLRAIKAAGYATDPNYIANVGALIDEIKEYAKSKGWPSSEELAKEHPEWYANAEKNQQGAEVDSGSASVTAVTICAGSGVMGSGELVSGGMTLEQAQAFMEAYAVEADKFARGNLTFDGATIQDAGCPDGTLNNCSAFTQWFLNRYTTLGPSGVTLYQGSMAVEWNLRDHSELMRGEKVPKVYAIMSMGSFSGCSDGWCNHTGIVLGIDKEKDQIIIGEASCGESNGGRWYRPGAHVYSLSEYTNSPSKFGPTYAYTDNVLKGI